MWWFESADMAFKILITSVISWLPNHIETPAGMAVVGAYVALLLVWDPYIRKGDSRLHLLSLTVSRPVSFH